MPPSESLDFPSSTVSLSEITPSTLPPNATGTSDQSFVTDTNKAFFNAVLATNSISVAASLFVITAYFFLRRKNPQIMSRTSLKLGVAMACSDTIYHSANLAGYGNLPNRFMCAFVGGWMFATPSLLSTFYACAIALNTQLVFVHNRVPNTNKQILYLVIPPILALLISTPTLIAGVYGFDDVFQYCWYKTHNASGHTVLVRIIMTWSLWISVAFVYLVFAVITITYSLFSKTGPLSRIGRHWNLRQHRAQDFSISLDAAMMLARRDIARRALTIRMLGYISVPVICVFPGVVMDLTARIRPGLFPSVMPLIAAITAGLMGTFNAVLLSFDPSVVAVVFWPHWKKKKEQERLRQNFKAVRPQPGPPVSTGKPLLLGDIEIAETKVVRDESQGVVLTTIHIQDHGLESHRHSATLNGPDLENNGTSTIGYTVSDVAEIYHGL